MIAHFRSPRHTAPLRRGRAACLVAALMSLAIAGATSCAPSNQPRGEEPREERSIDIQAHRGGRGETTEESPAAFDHAIDVGVTTLELDVVMSADGVPVVWHDPIIEEEKCSGPHVGSLVHQLTWAELSSIPCDKTLEDYPDARRIPGNNLARLEEIIELAEEKDPDIRYNIETKVEAEAPEQSASPAEFVDAILSVVDETGIAERTTIQSFDWSTLPLVARRAPDVTLAMLYDETTWKSESPWLGPVDFDACGGDLLCAAEQLDADILSGDYDLLNADEVDRFTRAGLQVLPWTVNEESDIRRILDLGVDGIITDYPQRALRIAEERGLEVD